MYPSRNDKLVFFSDPHISPDMFTINENIIRKIITQVFAEVRQEPSFFGPPETAGVASGSGTKRFVFQDVGFFDPFYDGISINTRSAMEHVGKNTYFRDVHVFIDRIVDVSRTKSDVVRQNLQFCFRDSVLKWYISEFTDNEKRLLTYGNGVEKWTILFRARFKTSKSTGMAERKIHYERFCQTSRISKICPNSYPNG